jgi:hypothetical protein
MTRFRFRGQFAIGDLLLLLTVVAAWTAYLVSFQRAERLKTEIKNLQKTVGELVVDDTSKLNAIGQTVVRYPDEAWQVYLPEGRTYTVHMATRGIKSEGFPENERTAEIGSGRHRFELRHHRDQQKQLKFVIAVDDEVRIEMQENPDWNKIGGSSSTGIGKTQEAIDVGQPLVLKRLRVNVGTANSSTTPPPGEPVNGLLVWITANNPAANALKKSQSAPTDAATEGAPVVQNKPSN